MIKLKVLRFLRLPTSEVDPKAKIWDQLSILLQLQVFSMLDKQAKFNSLPVKFGISELAISADSESQRHQTKVKNRIIRPVIKKLIKLFCASVPGSK